MSGTTRAMSRLRKHREIWKDTPRVHPTGIAPPYDTRQRFRAAWRRFAKHLIQQDKEARRKNHGKSNNNAI